MIVHRLWDSIRALVGRRRFEADMAAEFESHLEFQTDELVRRGVPVAEARRRARVAFGSVTATKDDARAARGIRWADEARQDVRFTLRALRRSPGYAAVAILTLAAGIGANSAIFSVIDGVLLKPLALPDPDRVVRIGFGYPFGALFTYRSAGSYEQVAAYGYGSELNLFVNGTAERVRGRTVSAGFFAMLGVAPRLGRVFREGEDAPGAAPVVVVSEGLWRRRLGADPAVVGRTLLVDGAAREIVGVMPARFGFPDPGTDVWIPVEMNPANVGTMWGAGGTTLIGRLQPGVALGQANAEHRALIGTIRDAFPFRMPDAFGQAPENQVEPVALVQGRAVRARLVLLLAAVGLVLLVACVNVATLNLTRLAGRERELAIRQALGGSRGRVSRQLVVEQLVVAAIGGGLGLVVAAVGMPVLISWLPADTPRLDQVALDGRAVVFTAAIVLVAALLSASAPLLRMPGAGRLEQLHVAARGGSAGRRATRLSAQLVGVEVALAVVLVISAGVLLRSLGRLLAIDVGVRVERLVTARVTPNPARCEPGTGQCGCDAAGCNGFFGAVEQALASVPGVRAVALGNTVPLDGRWNGFAMDIEDHPVAPGQPAPLLGFHVVSPDYFRTLGMRLVAGRLFTPFDRSLDQPVAVVSRSAAAKYWPGETAVGKHLKPVWLRTQATIVGVVADVRSGSLTDPGAVEEFYFPMAQWSVPAMTIVVESDQEAGLLEPGIRRAVAGVDPTATVSQLRSMRNIVLASVAPERSSGLLVGAFAALALFLGAIGVYGVLSFSVAERRRELAIRIAVGAVPGALRRLVLGQAFRLLGWGVAAGVAIAWLGASILDRFAFGISARDPVTFAAVPLVFGAIGLGAGLLPAIRATRVNPTDVLRGD
ncbi:MAG: ADOP family duplicated permease [Gemmatimonadales bacterium]